MNKGIRVLAVLLVMMAGIYALAADVATTYDVGRTHTIQLPYNAKVGNVLLKAGEYKVEHLMDGNNHVLVFRSGKQEKARVNCTMVDLPSKADRTSQEFSVSGQDRALSAVTFRGENYKHQF